MAMPTPAAPLGTFVDTSRIVILGVYPQNLLMNVNPGDEVELAFMTHPGQVFPAKVTGIVPATGEGQLVISGNLPSAAQLFTRGMFAVRFELEDQELASQLKMGTGGAAAIYTEARKPLHAISRIAIWIHAWRYNLLPM
jgi:multidrug resistance efflux pump